MASTSSSSSSSAPTSHYEYDVFLSFRGEDTRYSFTDHLYAALCKAGIRTFRDDDEIREGQELKPEIERSIKESRGSIIVFSENFADSSWCLDELWLILEQKRKVGHFVLPVFYKVDPSDVRNQRGSYSIEAKEGLKWTQDNVNRWKAALREVADLKGMVLKDYEKDFIANIVQRVYQQLGLEGLSPPTDLTGIEARVEVINSWLRYEQPDFPVLAICGMGGGGKTTLAKHVYYSNKHNFDSCSLLENIENQPDRLLDVQKQLLKDISGNNIMISNVDEGAFQLEKAIRMNKVLIVVDDIDEKETLSKLFGTKALHTQSKIIITTRIQNIDGWYGSISCGCHVHKVELLNEIESLELLSFHAFGSKFPLEGFEKLALRLAKYCGGNPLALKVLGSSLSVRAQDQRERNDMIEIWRSRMNSLNSSKGDLDSKIQAVLKRSYESLAYHHLKELFLHIACFFVYEYAGYVEMVLENEYQAKSGIKTLINRCLVTVERRRLMMHKLLQDMARNIVREESNDPAKRSRVWQCDESYHLLSKGDGSETIEGLNLDMTVAKQGMTSGTFKTSSLVKMKNLKLLQLRGVKLTGSYENFPDLIWLRWYECNLKTVPPGLMMSSLVAIEMITGDLEKFEPPMGLNSLKVLDLSFSYKLVKICNLHRVPKLEALLLYCCTSLTHVCKTIGDLENLSRLDLSGCTELWKALLNQKCVNQLERLKALCVCGGIPEQPLFALPQSLSIFNLDSSPFEILPSYIDLKMLRTLYLSCSPNLKSLLCLPSTLKRLNVDWCTSLERITFQSARFTLQEFSYEGCFKLFEIEGLFKLQSIGKLEEADLEHMQWIKSYQNHKVELVGDVITKGRTFNIQMLYEYGIRSTYLQGIEDQRMATHEYTSSSGFLSFRVPSLQKNQRIQGLNVAILYRSSGGENRVILHLLTKISNRTKGLTWVYVPVVYGKPSFDNDVVWLSYWPLGDILDTGDEVHVNVFMHRGMMMVRECGVSLVYRDDGEVEKDEKCNERKKGEEVIGGDLSLFQVTKGAYYLCRVDFFKSQTPYYLKQFLYNRFTKMENIFSAIITVSSTGWF